MLGLFALGGINGHIALAELILDLLRQGFDFIENLWPATALRVARLLLLLAEFESFLAAVSRRERDDDLRGLGGKRLFVGHRGAPLAAEAPDFLDIAAQLAPIVVSNFRVQPVELRPPLALLHLDELFDRQFILSLGALFLQIGLDQFVHLHLLLYILLIDALSYLRLVSSLVAARVRTGPGLLDALAAEHVDTDGAAIPFLYTVAFRLTLNCAAAASVRRQAGLILAQVVELVASWVSVALLSGDTRLLSLVKNSGQIPEHCCVPGR